MNFKLPIILLFASEFLIYSCEPLIRVVIANKTNTEKDIKVIYPATFTFPGQSDCNLGIRDSLRTYNLNHGSNYLHPVVIPYASWDTISRTYTFTLHPHRKALVEERGFTRFPTFGQVFIIDNRDTIELKKHGKNFIKSQSFFGVVFGPILQKKAIEITLSITTLI